MKNWDYEPEIEPIISPRPYQKEALNKVVVAYQSGITRQLISPLHPSNYTSLKNIIFMRVPTC